MASAPWPVPIVADASAIDLRADYTVKRVVEFCDGWFPYPHDGWDPKAAVTRLRQAAIDADAIPLPFLARCSNAPADPAALAGYRDAGIQEVLLDAPDLRRDEVPRMLDKNAALTKI